VLESSVDLEKNVERLDNNLSSTKATNVSQTALACPKCNALKIVKSRSKGLDGLIMRFIPRRPYRCLRCYHRFWAVEDFFRDNRRLWSWSVVIITCGLLVFI